VTIDVESLKAEWMALGVRLIEAGRDYERAELARKLTELMGPEKPPATPAAAKPVRVSLAKTPPKTTPQKPAPKPLLGKPTLPLPPASLDVAVLLVVRSLAEPAGVAEITRRVRVGGMPTATDWVVRNALRRLAAPGGPVTEYEKKFRPSPAPNGLAAPMQPAAPP